jgi:hypothetical protein
MSLICKFCFIESINIRLPFSIDVAIFFYVEKLHLILILLIVQNPWFQPPMFIQASVLSLNNMIVVVGVMLLAQHIGL